MNIYETKEMFVKMNKGKSISFDFDKNCLRKIELIFTDGNPNHFHHFEYDKVKAMIEGQDAIYITISPHRENKDWETTKQFIMNV